MRFQLVSSNRCSLSLGLEMATRVIFVVAMVIQVVCGNEPYRAGNEGLMDKLSNGMKFAKDFLGSESVALKVAEFVVRAFQTTNKQTQSQHEVPNRRYPYAPNNEGYHEEPLENERIPYESKPSYNVHEAANPLTPLKQLVKLFGLQPTQISAVAVNALLFVAQMISTFLSGPQRPGRPYRSDDPLTWILNKPSSKLQDLLITAKNESLPDIIEDLIQQQGSDEDISCVRLLVCKITPFVTKMQKAVFGTDEKEDVKERGAGASVMYRHLPSEDEINERSDVCEHRFKECDLEK